MVVQKFRLHMVPLAIAGIVITTMVPIELRHTASWDSTFDYADVVQNLLLYAPLGAALWRFRWFTVVLAACALSLTAETAQLWSFDRFASPYDVLSNTIGALFGTWVLRRFFRPSDRCDELLVYGPWLMGAVVVAAVVLATWQLPARSSAIADWNDGFALLLGNELTNDRPWEGTISEIAILRGVVPLAQMPAFTEHGAGEAATEDRDMLYYQSTPLNLGGGAPVHLPSDSAKRLVRAVTENGEFTLIARITAADLNQDGPARIVTFSSDTMHRNFDLGQEQDRITFRVRTPVSGANGEKFHAETPPILKAHKEILIVATYDGSVARIFVDGILYGRSNIAAAGCTIPAMCNAGIPMVWAILGAIFATLTLAFWPWRGRLGLIIAAIVLGGAAAIALPRILHLVPAEILRHFWLQCTAFIGALTICVAYGAASNGSAFSGCTMPRVSEGGRRR